jgi:PAS domain S-box-containing protein
MFEDEHWPGIVDERSESRKDLIEINNRLFELFMVHAKTGHSAQQCTSAQLWEIKRGMEEIRRIILEYVPEEKRRQPLLLLNEFLSALKLATTPLVFGSGELFYPRMLYMSIFEAANEAEVQDAPAWILDHMVGPHIIYDETGYILHASMPFGGYTKEEIVGKHFTQFVIPDHIPLAIQRYGGLFEGRHGTHAYLLKDKEGVQKWVTFHCHPYNKGDKLMVLSALREGHFEDHAEEHSC